MQNELLQDTLCANFQAKRTTFSFWTKFAEKRNLMCRNFEKLSPDTESAPPRYHCANFQAKRTTFTFSAQICPKKNFGVGISKL